MTGPAPLEQMSAAELALCDRAWGTYCRELGRSTTSDEAHAFYRAFHLTRGRNQHSKRSA